jgi:hypothetical protein
MPIAKVSIRLSNKYGCQKCDLGTSGLFMHLSKIQRLFFLSSAASILAAVLALSIAGCGYRVRSSVGTLPSEAHSLGIPTFQNITTQYKIEQLISAAVLKEFSTRSRAVVNSSNSGVDLVLKGEIRDISSAPVTFGAQSVGSQTFGSAYLISIQLSVKLLRMRDSAIIWQNDDFVFRERYIVNGDVREFFSEENPALERLARNLAASLASSILNRSTP